ncbi:MAG TPA: copper homeostasis protein CutC [Clostridiaceae bacterium]|nr:copper homeostasis protein CutC [Clostridiaceae bacterium]
MKQKILIEICCGSLDDALIAEQAGADRIELNSCLLQGGLTPSLGTLIETKKRLKIPVIAMVRPRGAGFCYTDAEVDVMMRDAEIFVNYGADGIVFGFLNADGTIDVKNTERMLKIMGDKEAVFHRAFDVVPDPFIAIDQLIELGVTRVLTSGQEPTAYEGAPLIAELIKYAKGRIQILPGGGITLRNVKDVIRDTGADQIHFTSFATQYDNSTTGNPKIYFGGALYPPEDRYDVADINMVSKIINSVKET